VKAKWSGQGHLADNSSGIALRMSDQFTARLLLSMSPVIPA